MKIIKKGVSPKPATQAWPIGRTLACPLCKCRFQVEKGDKFTQTTARTPGGPSVIAIVCPDCKAPLSFSRPTESQ